MIGDSLSIGDCAARERDPETDRVLDGIRKLAERLLEERHTYLKFYGD